MLWVSEGAHRQHGGYEGAELCRGPCSARAAGGLLLGVMRPAWVVASAVFAGDVLVRALRALGAEAPSQLAERA